MLGSDKPEKKSLWTWSAWVNSETRAGGTGCRGGQQQIETGTTRTRFRMAPPLGLGLFIANLT